MVEVRQRLLGAISSEIPSGILSDIFLAGIFLTFCILFGTSSDILSEKSSDGLSGVLSDILSGIS